MSKVDEFIVLYLMKLRRYPVYSFFLPIYSFWRMDEFGWGNTRIVVNDGSNKKVVSTGGDFKFNESMIPYRKFSGKCLKFAIYPLLIPHNRTRGRGFG